MLQQKEPSVILEGNEIVVVERPVVSQPGLHHLSFISTLGIRRCFDRLKHLRGHGRMTGGWLLSPFETASVRFLPRSPASQISSA